MIEVLSLAILAIVVFALCALIAWLDWNNRKERSKLINAIVAKTPEQMRDLEFVEKVQTAKIETPSQSDLIDQANMSDEDFEKYIEGDNGQSN